MRKVFAIAVLFIAGAVSAQVKITPGPGTNTQPLQVVQSQGNPDAAKRITREEAMKLVKEGKAVYVDVRSKETFDFGHLPGAMSLPGSQLIARMRELPPGKMAITYCACEKEHTAAIAVLNLNNKGWKNAAALVGGWHEWTALGLPTEVTRK
jgi:rhodanese-related sulfurtransferase